MNEHLLHLRRISHRCEARELANIVHEVYFNDQKPNFPINVFEMLKYFGIEYQFLELEKIDGLDNDNFSSSLISLII